MTDTTLTRLARLVDYWGPGTPTDMVTMSRADAERLHRLLKDAQAPLSFAGLGLDPDDLGHDVDEEACELYGGDGPLLAVVDYDGHDPESIRAVADWWDRVAEVAQMLANELRAQALGICEDCRGYGTVGQFDGDCRGCGGTGRAA